MLLCILIGAAVAFLVWLLVRRMPCFWLKHDWAINEDDELGAPLFKCRRCGKKEGL